MFLMMASRLIASGWFWGLNVEIERLTRPNFLKLVLLLFICNTVYAQDSAAPNAGGEFYRLGPGDQIHITAPGLPGQP
jgi:protein involved in polysaccharide export with SLBB domain